MSEKNINPYHYIRNCLLGKWKLTILHHIHTYDSVRFNQLLNTLPISEKVLSQQLRELLEDGVIARIVIESRPVKIKYVLTPESKELIEALDILFIWSIKQMKKLNIPIDPDAFVVHNTDKYRDALNDIINFEEYLSKADKAYIYDQKIITDL
ncbi:transcriptional regulator [Candidatus Epulonipiscium fishelsonii]|uniref:Transcriptional regulator n=1 Tax=Candidatus Epulonipiscium fishelsonii TaxID=77094 RepID=A0ACC8X9P8_9FIRM|nr:transcriptional regulator [Epulopiscium sp. SCG-B11WGA-EpuloA1]ONI42283.1 transcriptional regulator [Epulopiscium sp. SCG-B05WGA-EpuloA1]